MVRTQPSQPAAKRVTPIADLLPARPDATFADSADAVVQTWVRLLDESQGVDVVAGDVAGLDLFDGERILRSRVFLFLPDRPLGDDALARLLESVSEAAPGARRAVRIHGIDGSTYHDRNGTCFLGVDDPHDTGAVIWVVSDSEDDVRAAIDAFRAAALAG